MNKKIIYQGTIWKFLERTSVFGIQFIVHIILARILSPSDYGSLDLMMVFVSISNVLIQTGFNTALIQKKELDKSDYSSVLWISLLFSLVIYFVIFLCSPSFANLFRCPEIIWPLRVISLVFFPGALYSVQIAKITRDLDFSKIFYSNLFGATISGTIGIYIAYKGGGLWALVFQHLINTTVCCVVLWFTSNIVFKLQIKLKRIKELLSFGWKLVVSGLLNTLTEQLNSMIIGYNFSTESLGYYSRGMQFPNYSISIIEGTMTGVLLPSLSKVQDEKKKVKSIMRNAMLFSSYIVFPMMGGLAVVSKEIILLLLTEKWLGSVEYLRLFCGVFALYPIHVCNLQTYNALGRSDLFLKLEIIKKIYNIAIIFIVIKYFDSPLSVAACTLLLSPLGWYVNSFPNGKLIEYGFFEQIKDIMPILLCTFTMMVVIYPCSFIKASALVVLIVKVLLGILSYIAISIITKNKQFKTLIGMIKEQRINKEDKNGRS